MSTEFRIHVFQTTLVYFYKTSFPCKFHFFKTCLKKIKKNRHSRNGCLSGGQNLGTTSLNSDLLHCFQHYNRFITFGLRYSSYFFFPLCIVVNKFMIMNKPEGSGVTICDTAGSIPSTYSNFIRVAIFF